MVERRSIRSRLWAAAAPDYFDFEKFGTGDFVGALGETLQAESLTRVPYPDDSTTKGQGLRFFADISWSPVPWPTWFAVFQRYNADWEKLPEKAAIQLNDTHPSMSVPELMRICSDDVHLGWDQAWDLTKKDVRVHKSHLAA